MKVMKLYLKKFKMVKQGYYFYKRLSKYRQILLEVSNNKYSPFFNKNIDMPNVINMINQINEEYKKRIWLLFIKQEIISKIH